VPRQAFAHALEYLLSTYSISEAKPCEIRASLSKLGLLDRCTRLKGQMIIQYILPFLQAAALVKIDKSYPLQFEFAFKKCYFSGVIAA
jgi:hypothetical protein